MVRSDESKISVTLNRNENETMEERTDPRNVSHERSNEKSADHV